MSKRIAEDFYFLERGWLNANQFVFNGEKKILIDTGYISDFSQTKEFIEDAGVRLSEVDLIVSTHSHCDHIGGNKKIWEISGCQIAMHRIDKYFIDSKDAWATWYKYYGQEADFFPVDITLEEGDSIFLDGLKLEVIHTPGHGAGMIALYSPEEKFLISSDACWDGDLGAITTRIEGTIAPFLALDSLEKLSKLHIERMYPGHGPPIDDPQSAIEKCREKIEMFLKEPARIGKDQMRKIFIYILLMKGGFQIDRFLEYLLTTYWYKETGDLFFNGEYERMFEETIQYLRQKGLVHVEGGKYFTTVSA